MAVSASPTVRAGSTSSRARYIGVDVARFLAIVGMMAAHLITIADWSPTESEAARIASEVTTLLTDGIAAPLFAVLGGVSSAFATRSLLRAARPVAAIWALVIRGALLIVIGLLLGMLDNPIVVVLAYYGAAMILIAPLIAARGWIIATIALVLGAAGGPLNALIRVALDVPGYEGRSVTFETFGVDWIEAIRALLITGVYPALTWAVYLLVGVLIGRMLLGARSRQRLGRIAWILTLGGAALASTAQLASNFVLAHLTDFGFTQTDFAVLPEDLLGAAVGAPLSPDLWAQLLAVPHSGSPMDILRTTGIAAAILGLLVLLCDVALRSTPRWLELVRTTGAAPLTIYTAHVLVTGWLLGPIMRDPGLLWSGEAFPWWSAGVSGFALQLAGALLIGLILMMLRRRGPLEALLSGAVRILVRVP